MTLWKGVYHGENQKIHWELQYLFKANHSCPWTVPLWVNPCVTVALGVSWLALHGGHTHAIMCNYGGLCQQMHKKSILEISCTYSQSSYSGYVSNASGKSKEHIKQLLNQ